MLYFFCSIPQHLLISLFVVVVFLPFWWSRTPTFHSLLFSGYVFVFLIHYVSYFPCFLAVAYPDISFFIFLWVRAFSYITYCGFSTLLFTKNIPQHFIFNISRGTTLHHTFHTLPPTTHKSILWRRFAPEYAFLASLPFPIVFRQPEAHLPHYLPYTFADISDTSGTVSTMPSVPEMPLITSMPIEYIFTTCIYGIM